MSKRFGGVQALRDVSLAIERGSIHGLVGENGAGKSTLAKIIAGVHRADKGRIVIDGREVDYRSPREALADGVTMIAQEPTLVPRRSVLKNIFLGIENARLGVVNAHELRRQYGELVESVGFDLDPDRLTGTLSVADQQKVEVLRAVARNARLIVLDEPTAALTVDEAQRLFETIRRLRDRGATLIYVSHFLAEVLELVDTVTVLRDGRVIRTSPARNETPDSLATGMLGRTMELTFPAKTLPPGDAPEVLSVQHLSRPPRVLDVSFTIRAGEILGLAGLIGSGRTEVARAIFGADRADSGEIRIDGHPLTVRSPVDAIRAGIAMLPESRKEHGLLMQRSITDNISLPHLPLVTSGGVVRRGSQRGIVEALARQLDVRARGLGARVDTLSGGNQQKVLFGKWLFQRPLVLLADEPTRGIDVGAKRAIYELLRGLAAEGLGVLLISSEHEEIVGLAHRVLVMRKGQIIEELEGDRITEDAIVRAALATSGPNPEAAS